MRVLVTVSPRVYRESVAASVQRARPDLEVRAASPEEAELELAGFGPHLLVHNDALPVPKEALEGVHTLELSGRSANFKLDRIHLRISGSPSTTLPESPRTGG